MNYFIVDGMNLAFRSHYAFQRLSTPGGVQSGCVYGFLAIMRSLKLKHRDYQFVIAWDSPAKRKKELYTDYKANRVSFQVPEQVQDIRKIFSSVNVHQHDCPGEEADDIIATLVELNSKDGNQLYIYSSDKDLMQLVENGKVIMVRPQFGAKPAKYFDEEAVKDEMGVSPKDLNCFLAFRGDTSDNIPGVSRVKSSMISSLIEKYKTPGDIYMNLHNEKMTDFQKESFKNFEKQIYVNYSLTSLDKKLELNSVLGTPNVNQIEEILNKYEIKAFTAEAYISIFERNEQFLNRTSQPVENYSLFEKEA